MLRRSPATSTNNIQKAILSECFNDGCHFFGSLVILAKSVGETSIGETQHPGGGVGGYAGQKGLHVFGTKGTVQPNTEKIHKDLKKKKMKKDLKTEKMHKDLKKKIFFLKNLD